MPNFSIEMENYSNLRTLRGFSNDFQGLTLFSYKNGKNIGLKTFL